MLEVIAVSDDDVILPILVFDLGLDVFGLAERTNDFDLVFHGIGGIGLNHRFLSALGEDASTALFVQDAAVGFASLEVSLVSGDDRAELALFNHLAPILNPGIAIDDAI